MTSRVTVRAYGTVSAGQQQQMTGLEFVQGLADGTLPLNTIAKTLGYEILRHKTGASSLRRAARHPPKSGRNSAWWACSHDARQLHGARDPIDFGEGDRLHDA